MFRKTVPKRIGQATMEAPTLARLATLALESSAMLRCIESLVPPGLRAQLQAGPWDQSQWCILVSNNAVAAKLRQLQPALESHLRSKGWNVQSLRLKVVKQTT
ncbi:MAG: hypothetical protein ACT4NV_01870 [Rhodoferax sp.]